MTSAPIEPVPVLAGLPLVIEAARVRLRPLVDDDAEALFPYVSDPELPRYMTWAAHTSIDDTRAWIRSTAKPLAAGTDLLWAIEHAGAPIGCVGLHGIRWHLAAVRYDRAELGYWLAPPFWGRGLMTEAAIAVTTWAFETMGLHKVNVMCFEPNVGSRRVIEKAGFRFVGRAESDVWRDGEWHAHLKYERVRP